MKATRHNGRSGKHGTYDVKHNDRRFDVENSEHIDAGQNDPGLSVPERQREGQRHF